MTRKQWKKHHKCMEWFYAEEGREVWRQCAIGAGWGLDTTCKWYDHYMYVPNDQYAEFRKAQADGKAIEYTRADGGTRWSDHLDDSYNHTYQYRIKPDEPTFKVGDYVTHEDYKNIAFRIQEDCGNGFYNVHMNHRCTLRGSSTLKLWTLEDASDDEWVFYRMDGLDTYTMMTVKKCKGLHSGSEDVVPYIGQTPEQLGFKG